MISITAARQRLEKLFGSKDLITKEEAYLSDGREPKPEDEEKNKVWLRNKLTDLKHYKLVKVNYVTVDKHPVLKSIQVTEDGRRLLRGIDGVATQTTTQSVKHTEENGKVTSNEIMELLKKFKEQNPDFLIKFDFSIQLKDE